MKTSDQYDRSKTSLNAAMQAQLAQSSVGRMMLHTICACRDHKYAWHWSGVMREITAWRRQA